MSNDMPAPASTAPSGGTPATTSPAAGSTPSDVAKLEAQNKELRDKVRRDGETIKSLDKQWGALVNGLPNGPAIWNAIVSGDHSALSTPTGNTDDGVDPFEEAMASGDGEAMRRAITMEMAKQKQEMMKEISPQLHAAKVSALDGTIRQFFSSKGVPELANADSAFMEFYNDQPEVIKALLHADEVEGLNVVYDRYVKEHGDPTGSNHSETDLANRRAGMLESGQGAPGHDPSFELELDEDGNLPDFAEAARQMRAAGVLSPEPLDGT